MGDWAAIEREVIDGFFRFSPSLARYKGDHRFDGVVREQSRSTIQARVAQSAASLTRQVFWTYTTGEGFAHHVEEMMLEIGYTTDPKHVLAQRLEALLRDARFLVAIGLQCQGMTVPDAIRVFESVGSSPSFPRRARRRVERGIRCT